MFEIRYTMYERDQVFCCFAALMRWMQNEAAARLYIYTCITLPPSRTAEIVISLLNESSNPLSSSHAGALSQQPMPPLAELPKLKSQSAVRRFETMACLESVAEMREGP